MSGVAKVVGAVAAIGFTALTGGLGAPLVGTGLLASLSSSTAVTAFAMNAFRQIAVGVALSALSRALAPSMKPKSGGTHVSMDFGETVPLTFIMGSKRGVRGQLIYHNSWGKHNDTPNEYYVQVIKLSDWPARLNRCFINGEVVELKEKGLKANYDSFGKPVKGYESKGEDRLFVKFLDGTQTTADPYLLEKFGDDPDKPWTSDMIGKGSAIAIVTAGMNRRVNRQKPACLFELGAWGHYDRRKDSTAGGFGPQRRDKWKTWTPSDNPVVMIDNILGGIKDPISGDFIWGGQDISFKDLPSDVWFSAMNECDRVLTLKNGNHEAQYRASMEVRVDSTPADIIETLLVACQGQIAEVAGEWHIHAGPPSTPVYAFDSKKIIITEANSEDPFVGLDEAFNEVDANYLEPDKNWAAKAAPTIKNTTYLTEDFGRKNVATLDLDCVPYSYQVQRLMLSALKDARRMRKHVVILPPEARFLGPLDEVAFTSEEFGYENKHFSIDLIEDMDNGCTAAHIRERDPTDYDYNNDDDVPADYTPIPRPPRPIQVADFAVEPATVPDDEGNDRVPAIKLLWTVKPEIDGVLCMVRLASDKTIIPIEGQSYKKPSVVQSLQLVANGHPVIANDLEVGYVFFDDETTGQHLIHGRGILPDTEYEVNAIYAPTEGRKWLDTWLTVTTPDIKIGLRDLEDEVNDKINQGIEDSSVAKDLALGAIELANETAGIVDGLTGPVLDRLETIEENLAGLETGTVQELLGIAVAGLKKGWVKDPTFNFWTNPTAPDYWTVAGFSTTASRVTTGVNPSSLQLDVPSGTLVVEAKADSGIPGQVPGADFKADYVTVQILLRVFSGSVAGAFLRAEWTANGTTWVAGHSRTVNNFQGAFSDIGIVVDSTRMQSRVFTIKRPIDNPIALRLYFRAHGPTPTTAVSMRIDYLDVGVASDADIQAFNQAGNISTAINQFSVTLQGPGGALAALQTTLETEFGPSIATLQTTYTTLSNSVSSLAGQVNSLSASFGNNNLVLNGTFEDGVRAAGDTPNSWHLWPAIASVIARDSTSLIPAIANAPTKYVGKIPSSAVSSAAAAVDQTPCAPGDNIYVRISYAGIRSGTLLNFNARIICRFYAPDSTTRVGADQVRNFNVVSVNWIDSDIIPGFAVPAVVPAGAAYYRMYVQLLTGGVGDLLFTQVWSNIVDPLSYATAKQAIAVSASADSAISSITSKVEAKFGDWDAFITETSGTVAWAEGAASSYVLKVTAGGQSAGLRIFAIDDPEGTSGAGVILDGDVIAPKSIAAGSLVITDLKYNMVPDSQVQVNKDWAYQGDDADYHLYTLSAVGARSLGTIRFTPPVGGSFPRYAQSSLFTGIRPGQRLLVKGQFYRVGGTTMRVSPQLVWYDRDRIPISTTIVNLLDTTATGLRDCSQLITVPAGIYQAAYRFVIWDTDASYIQCYSPYVVSNEDASTLITPDSIFVSQLTAKTAWIGTANIIDANIVRLHVLDGAISNQAQIVRTTNLTVADSATWVTIGSVNITKTANIGVNIFTYVDWVQSALYNWAYSGGGVTQATAFGEYRVLRGATEVGRGLTPWATDNSTAAGSFTYSLQVRCPHSLFAPDVTVGSYTFVSSSRSLIIAAGSSLAIQQVVK